MKIGIIGVGAVGSAVKYGMEALGHKVKYHDTKYDTKIEDILDTEICYICVPTPLGKEGKCDTSIVESVIEELHYLKYNGIMAIKSTVIPGTTKNIKEKYNNHNICFVPEFLRERCAVADFCENHDLLVIGTDNKDVFNKVKKSHGKYPKLVKQVSETEAEFCKYFNNIYNATLITLANSFYEVCDKMNINYSNVKETIIHRNHINDVYLDCNENIRGFGGMCLPKDTSAIASLVEDLGLDIDFFKLIITENNKYKTTVFKGMRKEL